MPERTRLKLFMAMLATGLGAMMIWLLTSVYSEAETTIAKVGRGFGAGALGICVVLMIMIMSSSVSTASCQSSEEANLTNDPISVSDPSGTMANGRQSSDATDANATAV